MSSFIEAYRPHRVLVVNGGLEEDLMVGETPVYFILGTQLRSWLSFEGNSYITFISITFPAPKTIFH